MAITPYMAWRNIWRHKRRSWLTIISIAFSALLFVVSMPLQDGAYETMIELSLRTYIGHAQVQRPDYQKQPKIHNVLDNVESLATRLRATDAFGPITVRAAGNALLSSAERSYGVQIVGVQTGFESNVSTIPLSIKQGSYLSSDDSQELVIGAALARNLKLNIGDEVTLLGSSRDGSVAASILPVVGIFDSGSRELDRFIAQIPLHTFQDIFAMGDSAHSIVVMGKTIQERDSVPVQLAGYLGDEQHLAILNWEQLLPGLKQTIELDRVTDLVFLYLLVVVVVFGILNTFLMTVLERTKEFGLMLALGAKPWSISSVVMMESMSLTALGLAIGTFVGIGIDLYLVEHGFSFPGMKEMAERFNLPIDVMYPQLSTYNILFGPILVLITTYIAAWIPLLRIHRLRPVEAMRTV